MTIPGRLSERSFPAALFLLAMAYVPALWLFPLEPDSAQYASIAREMADGSSWLRVQHRGQDYLDKPPWLFWVGALFFRLFGTSAFTWHLSSVPAFILLWEGLRRFFEGWGASRQDIPFLLLLTFSAPATALMFSDIRCELWLTVFSSWAWWSGIRWLQNPTKSALILSGIFLGGALLSKSIVSMVLILPVWSLYALRGRLPVSRAFVLAAVSCVLALLILSPVLWGLWQAFGAYGLRFFFWIQTFGRITGESAWSNNPDPFFLWHTALWAWTPAVWGLLVAALSRYPGSKRLPGPDGYALAALLTGLLAFSLSRYQLSHYIYPLTPLAVLALRNSPAIQAPVVFGMMTLSAAVLYVFVTVLCVLMWDNVPFEGRVAWCLVVFFLLCVP